MSEWISVKDRLPKKQGQVIIVYKKVRSDKPYVTAQEYFGSYGFEHVTHWMPLPEPPKE